MIVTDTVEILITAIQELSLARSNDDIMNIVKTSARKIVNADGVTIVLREKDLCYYVDEDAISPLWKGKRFPMETCISGWVMLNSMSAVIEDIYVDDRIPADAYRPTFVKSLAMVPILSIKPIGAIGIYWAHKYLATPEELKMIQALADSTAIAFENTNMYFLLYEANKELTLENEEKEKRASKLILTNKELKISRNKISSLFNYVQSKRELEKRKTGKEIHDEITQMLTVLKWRINSLDKALQGIGDKYPEDIDMLSQNLEIVYQKTKNLMTELLPSVLNHLGFVAALEWQINDFQKRTEVKCILNIIPESIPLSWEKSTILYRISNSLLTNVAEHAHATEVKIELNLKEDSIVLKIIDNGIGITKEQLNNSESYGLLEIKERIKLLDGIIDIKGFPDRGTRIKIRIKSDKENN